MKQHKVYFLSLLIATLSFADSEYQGKYLCNKSQILEIKQRSLYIGNTTFEYYQSMKRPVGIIDVFLKGNEMASMTPQPSWSGHYSLNIRNLKNKNEKPYVADCTKVK